MLRQIAHPKNSVNILAGLTSLLFERLAGEGLVSGGNGAAVVIQPEKTVPAADDLTEIDGIGPTFAKRLEAAGIYSFASLAQQTPEHVREVAKVADWQGDPADWIAAARKRLA
jgi:predicted flap endonuclease-1-like 5' DNA nuclease